MNRSERTLATVLLLTLFIGFTAASTWMYSRYLEAPKTITRVAASEVPKLLQGGRQAWVSISGYHPRCDLSGRPLRADSTQILFVDEQEMNPVVLDVSGDIPCLGFTSSTEIIGILSPLPSKMANRLQEAGLRLPPRFNRAGPSLRILRRGKLPDRCLHSGADRCHLAYPARTPPLPPPISSAGHRGRRMGGNSPW